MSDANSQLAQQDVAVDALPPYNPAKQGLLVRCEAGQLLTGSGSHARSGDTAKLIGFGEQLSAEKIHTLLSSLFATNDLLANATLILNSYQPMPAMKPAVVIGGINNLQALKTTITELANTLAIELAIVDEPPTVQQPGVLLMDMDSTAIQIECIDEIAVLAGVGDAVAAVTRQAMAGELDFGQSLTCRVATLTGADESILAEVANNLPLMPGLEILVEHLKAKGWVVAIASGGFTYFTEQLKTQLGLTATFANQLEIVEGKLTGKVLGDIVDADVKATVVERLATEHGIAQTQTVAIGDGANDLKMLNKAALGVAFHAKPIVRQQAKAAVNQGGLEQLLYLLLPR